MRLVFSVSLCSNQMLLLSRWGYLLGAAERSSTFTPESANRADRRYQYIQYILYQLYVSSYVPYGQQAMEWRSGCVLCVSVRCVMTLWHARLRKKDRRWEFHRTWYTGTQLYIVVPTSVPIRLTIIYIIIISESWVPQIFPKNHAREHANVYTKSIIIVRNEVLFSHKTKRNTKANKKKRCFFVFNQKMKKAIQGWKDKNSCQNVVGKSSI